MCDPILVTLLKMRPHPAAHPYQPLIRKYPGPSALTQVLVKMHTKIYTCQPETVLTIAFL